MTSIRERAKRSTSHARLWAIQQDKSSIARADKRFASLERYHILDPYHAERNEPCIKPSAYGILSVADWIAKGNDLDEIVLYGRGSNAAQDTHFLMKGARKALRDFSQSR